MIGATMAWMATALLVCVPLAFYTTRMRKAPPTYDRNTISLLWKWIIASVLIIIGIVGLWSPSSPEWVRALSPICIFFCLLFSYLANHQLFYGIARPVLTNKLFLTTTLFSCIVLLLDWLRGTNRGVFLTNEPFEPTFVYYAYYTIGFCTLGWLYLLLVQIFWKNMWRYAESTYILRCLGGFTGFGVGFVGVVILQASLLLSVATGDRYREILNQLYYLCLPVSNILLLVNIAPQSLLLRLTPLIERVQMWYWQRQQAKLACLHHRMTQVVESIQRVPPALLSPQRILVEINDSRDLIWSHIPHTHDVPPNVEAAFIHTLLRDQATLRQAGRYAPLSKANATIKHLTDVATHVQWYEAQLREKKGHHVMQSQIPTLAGLPLIGQLPAFRSDRLNLYLRAYYECGDIGQYRVGPWQIVQLHTPDYVHAVLVDRAYNAVEKAPVMQIYLRPLLGHGLLTSDGAFHRRQRRLVAPALQPRHLMGYAEVMTAYAEQSMARWQEGEEVDLAAEMMQLALGIAGKTLFDADVHTEAQELGAAITTITKYANDQMTTLVPFPLTWPLPRNRRVQRAIARLDATVYRIIQDRRTSQTERGDLLSLLLHAQDEDDGTVMTDQQVRDEAMTLLMAGHETTANALAWTWYLLTQHPHIYTQVRQEVDHVLDGRTPTLRDLPNLPYTLRVFKEAIRLYPPVYVIPRQVVQPLEIGPYCIPAGTLVAVSPYVLHRNPAHFPDPERFDPDRWTPENEAKLPRYAYLPFGAGPHICPGNHFAMMEAQLVLATLVQHVTFDLVPGQRVVPEPLITLRPKGGIRVVVRRR